MAIRSRKHIKVGMLVVIKEEETKELMRGYVKEIITKNNAKKGILVRLRSGKVGRVVEIPDRNKVKTEQFKFLNEFLYLKDIYSIWDNENRKFIVLKSRNENTAVLFSSKDDAFEFIKEKELNKRFNKLSVNRLNRKKLIVENFKTLDIKYFIIDKKIKISHDVLREKEIQFNKLLK